MTARRNFSTQVSKHGIGKWRRMFTERTYVRNLSFVTIVSQEFQNKCILLWFEGIEVESTKNESGAIKGAMIKSLIQSITKWKFNFINKKKAQDNLQPGNWKKISKYLFSKMNIYTRRCTPLDFYSRWDAGNIDL